MTETIKIALYDDDGSFVHAEPPIAARPISSPPASWAAVLPLRHPKPYPGARDRLSGAAPAAAC
jgi:hypothetical protein